MPKCSFCHSMYEFPRGLTYVLIDGTVMHFCSSKCRKNFKMGRKNKKVKWVRKMKHAEAEAIAEIKEGAVKKSEKVEDKSEEKKAEKKETSEKK
jgi:large subunit ribosomal protein L24e